MQSHLLIGTEDKSRRIAQITRRGYLCLDDGTTADALLAKSSRAVVFDPARDGFNPLEDASPLFPKQFTAIANLVVPGGETTLTLKDEKFIIRNAIRLLRYEPDANLLHLHRLLTDAAYRDKLIAACNDRFLEETWHFIREKFDDKQLKPAIEKVSELLESEAVRRILCSGKRFRVRPTSSIVARIDPGSMGEDEAKFIGLLLIARCPLQIILPNGGFWLQPIHRQLIYENRLTVGVNFLGEVSPQLRSCLLTIKNKIAVGCSYDDAVTLAHDAGHYYDPLRPGGWPAVLQQLMGDEDTSDA